MGHFMSFTEMIEKGVQKSKKVIKTLKKWNGKLIEPKYTSGVSSSFIKKKIVKKWS